MLLNLSEEGAKRIASRAENLWKRLDILVNNAASFHHKTAEEATAEDWNTTLKVNVLLLLHEICPPLNEKVEEWVHHQHRNNFENDYTSTAFWHQEDPHKAFPPMPEAKGRLPAWPEGVALNIDKESKLRRQIASPLSAGKIQPDKEDSAKWEQLEAARNKEFRELRYDDFIRDVNAMETIANKYRQGTAK